MVQKLVQTDRSVWILLSENDGKEKKFGVADVMLSIIWWNDMNISMILNACFIACKPHLRSFPRIKIRYVASNRESFVDRLTPFKVGLFRLLNRILTPYQCH